jgi:hypothetical protein
MEDDGHEDEEGSKPCGQWYAEPSENNKHQAHQGDGQRYARVRDFSVLLGYFNHQGCLLKR